MNSSRYNNSEPRPALSRHAWRRCRAREVSDPTLLHYLLQKPEVVIAAKRYFPLRIALSGLLPSGALAVVRYNPQRKRVEGITVLAAGMQPSRWTPVVTLPGLQHGEQEGGGGGRSDLRAEQRRA